MSKDWFIADPHFGHRNIIVYEKRPFITTEEMDETIIENYNRVVSEGDTVYWLGDIFFCGSKRMKEIAERLQKGRNILVRGNHDRGISDSKFLRLGFYPVRMMLYKEDIILTHEPISEENMNYLEDMGVTKNIHGHVHSQYLHLDPRRYQCVSVENIDYTPISFEDLLRRFQDTKRYTI